MLRTQVCSNEGPHLFSRGDNYYTAKIHWRNFKKNLLQNHWANFNETWHNASFGDDQDSSLFKWRAPPFLRVDNNYIAKIQWQNLKIFFSITAGLISIEFGTMHSWRRFKFVQMKGPSYFLGENTLTVKILWQNLKIFFSRTCYNNFNQTWHNASLGEGVQVCLNEGPNPFPMGNDFEIAKIHCQYLKIFYSRTAGLISTKLGTMLLWMKGIQFFSNKEPLNSH